MNDTHIFNVAPIRERNLFFEKLLKMRETKPKDWEILSPAMRLSALQYEAGRREFERLENLRDEGVASDNELAMLENSKPKITASVWLCVKFPPLGFESFNALIEDFKACFPEAFFTKKAKAWFVDCSNADKLKVWATAHGLTLKTNENIESNEKKAA